MSAKTCGSTQRRAALLAGIITALLCAGVSVLVVTSLHGQRGEADRQRTLEALEPAVSLIGEHRLPRVLPDSGAAELQVLDPRGQVVASTMRLVGKPRVAAFQATADRLTATRRLCPPAGLKGCAIVASLRLARPDGTWLLYSAGPAVPPYVSLMLVVTLAGASLLITLVVARVAHRGAARRLAPVRAIGTGLAAITPSGMNRRVPVPERRNEIWWLARTANATLDRLQASQDQLRRLTADASHDLRNPITAIRTQLEEALLYPDADRDWPQTVRAVLGTVERLQMVVTDLELMAHLDTCSAPAGTQVDLGALASAELKRRQSSTKILTELTRDVFVVADHLKIARLLNNLLDNAERHARSAITVTVRSEGSLAVLRVTDDGEGIAAEHREMVFERFTRLDDSRDRDPAGTGLGLAIARQIAKAHHGSLTIEDSPRGARFVLRLPTAGSARRHQQQRGEMDDAAGCDPA